jgi:hypothetical protein
LYQEEHSNNKIKKVSSGTSSPASYEQHHAYRLFLSSLKTSRTKKLYSYYLNKYYLSRPENKNLTLDEILFKSTKEIENEIGDFVQNIISN